ncbi:MAG: polysaccharide export protein [Candidatus Gastranaerophilales bacterium]|nr:polysaccharide export protein [Candidatus Gastranaerophilales bacterium]
MKRGLLIFGLLTLILMNNCMSITAQTYEDKSSKFSLYIENNMQSREYILGPNDVINITVFESPEFDQKGIRIPPNGKITLMNVGTINVTGLSIEELQNMLIPKYKKYLNDPQISVNLEKTKPLIVYIAGAVMSPGTYEMETDAVWEHNVYKNSSEPVVNRKTPLLSNVIVAAGGISFDADLEHIKIQNKFEEKEYNVNLLQMLEKADSSQDIYLIAGDSIYVPKLPTPFAVSDEKYKKYASSTISPKSISVKVFGYVNSPGLVSLDSAKSLNLNSAIVAAGGYMKDSAYAPGKVYLSRADNNGKLVTKAVNPMQKDIVIMPNDTIYVAEKPRPLVGKTFDYMHRLIQPVNAFAYTYNNWALMFYPHRYGGTWNGI